MDHLPDSIPIRRVLGEMPIARAATIARCSQSDLRQAARRGEIALTESSIGPYIAVEALAAFCRARGVEVPASMLDSRMCY